MKKLIFIAVICVFIAAAAQADLNDYAVYGAQGVTTGTNVVIHGLVGSGGNMTIGGGSNLYDGGALAGGNLTTGTNIYADSSSGLLANGNITLGGGSQLHQNVEAGGNITSGTNIDIFGDAVAGGTIGLGGGSLVHGDTKPSEVPAPSYTPPSLPAPTSFSAGVGTLGAGTLAPGTYGTLLTGTNSDVYLSSGTYYFNAITIGGGSDLHLDLASGDILIYVSNNFTAGTNVNSFLTGVGGTAQDIYIETHGNFAWGGGGSFYGTVFAPGNTISLGDSDITTGTNVDMWGALYADSVVTLGGGSNINFVQSDYFGQETVVPVPGAVILGILGLSAAGIKLRKFA